MYPWSRPYVPHAARPLQAHPLSARLPAGGGTRTSVHERRRRISFRDCGCTPVHRSATCECVGELYANIVILCAYVYIRICEYQRAVSAERRIRSRCVPRYDETSEPRFSLRTTAINFSQPGLVSLTPASPFLVVVVARTRFAT